MSQDIPQRRNIAIALALQLVHLFQLAVLPLFLLPLSPWWLLALIPCALTTNPQWFLIHEAIHHGLSRDKELNDGFGRALCVTLTVPFEVVRFGHLMHHRFNGALVDRPDLFDPSRTSRVKAWVGYYVQLLGGFFLLEAASYAVFLLGPGAVGRVIDSRLDADDPAEAEMARLAQANLARPETVRTLRNDALTSYGLVALAFVLYGLQGFWWVPLCILLARGLLISTANNLPHYDQPTGDIKHGLNTRLPRWAEPLLLNFNHHRTHHHKPTVPWTQLPKATAERGDHMDIGYLRALLAQLKGPIAVRPRR